MQVSSGLDKNHDAHGSNAETIQDTSEGDRHATILGGLNSDMHGGGVVCAIFYWSEA